MSENAGSFMKILAHSSRQSYIKCRQRCKKYQFKEALGKTRLLEKEAHDDSDAEIVSSAVDQQPQSAFFTHLPPEIRRMIYEEAIGGNIFHLVKKADRLGFKKCTSSDSRRTCYSDELWEIETSDGVWKDTTDEGPLSMFLSCRKFHEEAIQILYTHNTFSFQSLSTILDLESSLRPEYFHSITSLLLNWFLKPDVFAEKSSTREFEDWRRVWAMIAGMNFLKHIRVTLSMVFTDIDDVKEARILGPLCKVGHLSTFDVDVPWNASSEARIGVPYQFTSVGAESVTKS